MERELRWAKLHRYVSTNTASYWARSFVDEFRDVCEHPPLLPKLPKLPAGRVLQAYQRASRRLVVTDYDGTLTQMQSLPRLATPAPVVTQLLATLIKRSEEHGLRRFWERETLHGEVARAIESRSRGGVWFLS